MKGWRLAGWTLVMAVALCWRIPRLDLRPMHNDEAVNAVKFGRLWVNNSYKYDPNEFHGPTLPYFTWPVALLEGGGPFIAFSASTFRVVTVLFGAALVLLPWLLRRDLGEGEALWAAALTALSPAMVFYSRYYIHEMLLVSFTGLAFIALWRAGRGGGATWTVTAGLALGLMAATKETFVFTLVALALAAATSALSAKWRPQIRTPEWRWQWSGAALALAMGIVTAALFYSSFFANPGGLLDAVRTYLPWLHRAGGATPHVHGWGFYFRRLFFYRSTGGPFWSEGFVGVLALIGFCNALGGGLLRRMIAFYTVYLTLIYMVLPYKTPWCLLGFYDGMILLAAMGAVVVWRSGQGRTARVVAATVLAAGLAQLGWQAWRENFGMDRTGVAFCATSKNPYVYSQTSPDLLRLVDTVDGLAGVSPEKFNTVVEVISPESYWPLPWYLRHFNAADVGYWTAVPDQPLAPIMMVAASLHAALDERPGKTHLMAGYFQLRPGLFLELYVNTNLWEQYVKTLPREAD